MAAAIPTHENPYMIATDSLSGLYRKHRKAWMNNEVVPNNWRYIPDTPHKGIASVRWHSFLGPRVVLSRVCVCSVVLYRGSVRGLHLRRRWQVGAAPLGADGRVRGPVGLAHVHARKAAL